MNIEYSGSQYNLAEIPAANALTTRMARRRQVPSFHVLFTPFTGTTLHSRFSKFYVATSSFPSSTFIISRLQHLLCHTLLIIYSHTMTVWPGTLEHLPHVISLSSFPNHLAKPQISLPKRHVYTHINTFWDLQHEMDDLNNEGNELEDLTSLFSRLSTRFLMLFFFLSLELDCS